MADEPTSPSSTTPAAPPPADPSQTPAPPAQDAPTITPKDIEGKTPDEIVKFVSDRAEAFGATKKELEEYKTYVNNAKPYIDAIIADPELTKQVEEAYKKQTAPPPAPEPPKTDNPQADDTRKALENQLVAQFEQSKGLDKLTGDAKKEMNVKVGQELMELLDPSGTKTYNEVIAGVSLEKLPKYLEKAYTLATMHDTIKQAQEQAQAEAVSGATGVMSSIPSSSPNASETSLTPVERELAKRMGVAEDKWLERKKQINDRNAK